MKGASSGHVPGPTGQMARSWQNQILEACGSVSAQTVNITQTPVSQCFFKLSGSVLSAQQGRHQDGVSFQRGMPMYPRAPCVTYVCPCGVPTRAPHGQGVPAHHKAALCAARLRATLHTLFPNSSPFRASAAASAVCLPLASSSLCWG